MLSFRKNIVLLLSLYMLITASTALAQSSDSLRFLESNLKDQYREIFQNDLYKRKEDAQKFYQDFCDVLQHTESYEYPFDSLQHIGKIYSDDHRLRIITWNVPTGFNENMHFGIVQYYARHDKVYRTVRLNDPVSLGENGMKTEWEGALYYKIIENKHAGRRYYTLLGYDLHTPFSNKKVIDIVAIDDFDEFYFCEKLISYEGKRLNRLSFEYNEKANMSLQYNENLKMIVFDHLSPSKPSLVGKYEFYGPDFTYDGLKWEKGIWVHQSNIDVTN